MSAPWSSFSADPRLPENAPLRASDADRDVVSGLLAQAYADGRLRPEEHDQRAGDLVAARTLGELVPLIEDLVVPTRAVAVPVGDRAVAAYRSDLREALYTFLAANAICWTIWFVTGAGFLWPAFVLLGTGLNLARIRLERTSRIEQEARRLERKDERKAFKRTQAIERSRRLERGEQED